MYVNPFTLIAFVPNEKQMAREKWQMHHRKNGDQKRKTLKQRREERKHMKKWSFDDELITAEPGESIYSLPYKKSTIL